LSGLWPLIPLVIIPPALAHFFKPPHIPELPTKPVKPVEPVKPQQPQQPKVSNTEAQPTPTQNQNAQPNQASQPGTTSSTPASAKSTSSGKLANTGANVLGLVGVALALIAGAALILRPSRRKDS
ncbi:LPXTG cell wall anchor domain-containing protein, partial [uncultured Corynebacterium sp.]